jgi:hypothetical protein
MMTSPIRFTPPPSPISHTTAPTPPKTIATSSTPTCPRCGSLMRQRSGRYGKFWGCSQYPRCRGTRNI